MSTSTPAKPKTYTVQHPQLGPVTGIINPSNVVQFRGIPYASVPGRFKRSVIYDGLPPGHSGYFTEYGPACPQVFGDPTIGGGPFPSFLPDTSPWPAVSDENNCLILNLNIPLSYLENAQQRSTSEDQKKEKNKLPVLVYIHGGGFTLGKIDAEHNTALLTSQSTDTGEPVISASLQYRVGALGFLHVPSACEEGNSNLALHDQRNALKWLQRFGGGFGADAERVMVFGESAGGMSICYHMLADPPVGGKPLFNRAVLMSGVVGPMTAPMRVGEAEDLYEKILGVLGIEERGEEGLGKLREVEVEKIVEASDKLTVEGIMWGPVALEEWFREGERTTWDRIPELIGKCEWVDEIVLGTTGFEGTAFNARLATVTPSTFLDGITDQLGEESASIISSAYNITKGMDQNLFITQAMRWVGDVIFDAPNHVLAKSLRTNTQKKVYRYVFNVRNPFPGHGYYQQAHHWVDVYFIFKTFQFRYPTQNLKDISTKHAQLWLDFANSKQPWSEYAYTGDGNEVIMVADERDGWKEQSVGDFERSEEWSWKRCEELWRAWVVKKGERFAPLNIEPMKKVKVV